MTTHYKEIIARYVPNYFQNQTTIANNEFLFFLNFIIYTECTESWLKKFSFYL